MPFTSLGLSTKSRPNAYMVPKDSTLAPPQNSSDIICSVHVSDGSSTVKVNIEKATRKTTGN